MRRFVLLAAVVAVAASPVAHADGLPVLGIDVGSNGVTVPGSADRYVTVDGTGTTLVERIARNGGRIAGLARVSGNFTIPAVAYDASASGLSADGKTLVLIEPRASFPRRMTRFLLLDARTLRVRRTVTLRGDFSFDAVSPHGRRMFLINYASPNDPTRYTVRAYDFTAEALVQDPVRDPAERSDKMRGSPITRVMSSDGRWAYTLYDGAGSTPFVHALDTVAMQAHCIDLPLLAGRRDLWALRLALGSGDELRVGPTGAVLARIDLTRFVVSAPAAAGTFAPHRGLEFGGIALAALLVAALAAFATRRRVRDGLSPA